MDVKDAPDCPTTAKGFGAFFKYAFAFEIPKRYYAEQLSTNLNDQILQ